jgi:hypothetical protein
MDLASKFNLSVTAYGEKLTGHSGSAGSLTFSAPQTLEPAPITPTGADAAPYQLLSGTIQSAFNIHRSLKNAGDDTPIFVTPGMMSGNTGTMSIVQQKPSNGWLQTRDLTGRFPSTSTATAMIIILMLMVWVIFTPSTNVCAFGSLFWPAADFFNCFRQTSLRILSSK